MFAGSEDNSYTWKERFLGAALWGHYVINMQPRLLDLFWMAPSVHSHLHKAQWDEWRYQHTHSWHRISRAGSMFALSSWHISFAGTASDIYRWRRGLFTAWTTFTFPLMRFYCAPEISIVVHHVGSEDRLNEPYMIQSQQIPPPNS